MKIALKRGVPVCLLLGLTLANASCSFINNFVVLNASSAALEVRYHVKTPRDPRAPTRLSESAPVTKPRSQLDEQVAWQSLDLSRYRIYADERIVVLTLNPDEALLLMQCRPANNATSGDCEPEAFNIDEIELVGINGETTLKGEQAHKAFARNRNTYTLTYY